MINSYCERTRLFVHFPEYGIDCHVQFRFFVHKSDGNGRLIKLSGVTFPSYYIQRNQSAWIRSKNVQRR